ncbi:MAG TPA: redox-sensing transcriptional repressor Rex [bacterium]|nr:redox-sensing transcriptional repressor Rex [bacterium]
MVKKTKIPEITITRLSNYFRVLDEFKRREFYNIASYQLAEEMDINDSQVRKDLAYFGQFGKPGMGYEMTRLKEEIQKILGLTRKWRVALVGVGNLGSALLAYKGFQGQGFHIIAAFDSDPKKMGKKWAGTVVYDITELKSIIRKERIEIGIITIPAPAAQEVANLLTKAGIKAILNFAPVRIAVPKNVRLSNVDLSLRLENLSFFLSR